MVMSRNTAVGSIVVGTIELTFGIITIICGAVAASKLSGRVAASAGLWAPYYAVPGILTISAGACRNTVVMAFALFFNVIGVIVSFSGAGASIALIIIFGNIVKDRCHQHGDTCSCFSYDDSGTTSSETFDMNCNDIDTLQNIMIAMAVVFVILTIVTFTASIYGCMGTCCVPAYAVPGILTISAGACRNTVVMAFALFFNIIGVIVSISAAGVSIAFSIVLNDVVKDSCISVGDTCTCHLDHSSGTSSIEIFDMNCSNLDTLQNVMIAMVIVFVILTIVTFTASIYGCTGTCCVPADTIVVVAGGIPVHGCGSTVIVQSSHSAMHGYAAPPPSYVQQYGDGNQLVKNMAI